MAIDLNTAPYYDDFTKSSNYYRILFKPGRAVQARELTQLQSTLQNQIEQFGRNIFKEGSLVLGGRAFTGTGVFLKAAALDTDSEFYSGKTLVGNTTGARAIVRVVGEQATIDGVTYPAILHVAVVNGVFSSGEVFTVEGTTVTGTLGTTTTFQGPSTFFSIDESVFFTKGHFVYCDPQTIVVSPGLTLQPSARLGLTVTEKIVDSDDDTTLLDPAVGSSNYFAPGADRLSIELALTSLEYDPSVEGSDEVDISNFIEIANLRNGVIVSQVKFPDFAYIEETLARRTYDESGDYTVRPFTVKVRDHIYGDNTKLSLEISPGKAYVKGYEFETTAPTYITLDRAQDFVFNNAYPVAIDYGRYVPVSNVIGYFGSFAGNVVTIHNRVVGSVNVTNNANFWSSVIGTARTRYLDWVSGNVFNLYLYDVNLNSGNAFSNARSFVAVAGPTVISSANVSASANISGNAAITYGADDTALFKLPYTSIRSVSDQTYTSQKEFTSVNFVTNGTYCNATITLSASGESFIGSGYLSSDARQERFFVTVVSGTGQFTTKRVMNLTNSDCTINVTSPTSAVISFTDGTNNFTGTVVSTIQTSPTASQAKTKILTTANVLVQHTANVFSIDLGYPDVFSIISVTDYLGNSYTGSYAVDSGQHDDFYDFGRAVLLPGRTAPNLVAGVNGNVNIFFKYFAHSGSGSYFSVNSYNNSGVTYGEIPQFVSSKGDVIKLSDVIDFRPVRSTTANTQIISTKLITPGTTFTTDYDYFLPRKDKLILNKERSFTVAKGISSLSPQVPSDDPDGMTLYTINLPAYTNKSSDVTTGYFDHRRYTMRDIGKIEKRVDRIEYYSALSFLEKIASDEKIESDIPGIDRFKNGILVDPFAGHSVGDVRNPDYRCSIDTVNNTLKPPIVYSSVQYTLDEVNSTAYVKYGDVITTAFTISPYISQLEATKVVNLTPFEVFNWTGRMTLTPATDVWGDTINNGTVAVNLNGENDAFTVLTPQVQGISAWSTSSGYKTVFTGVTDVNVSTSSRTNVSNDVRIDQGGNLTVTPTARTSTTTSTAVTTNSSRASVGLDFSASQRTISTNLGTKVVDTSIVPFMRERIIKFFAQNLKPNTLMYASFDDIDVQKYVRPAMEIRFTSNNVPSAAFSSITHSPSGWTGEVIGKGTDRVYVLPDTSRRPVVSGNTISFVGTAVTATIANVLYPSVLSTNERGDVAGIFALPNNQELRFNIGERSFKLADSYNKAFISSVAETKYLAYGISNTKENTIISTRYNLTNINPTLDIAQSGPSTSRTTSTDAGQITTGTSSTAVIVPVINQTFVTQTTVVNQNFTTINQTLVNQTLNQNIVVQPSLQTLICGQTPRSSGGIGRHSFVINLGNTTGSGNVVCNTGIIPDRFTLEYGGRVSSTGFISSGSAATAGIYNQELVNRGHDRITQFNATNVKLPFFKQRSGQDEFAIVTVDAPLAGTGWNFNIECPTTPPVAAPGTASLIRENTQPNISSFWANQNAFLGGTLRTTGALVVNYLFTITNTASNPNFHLRGTDKTITINSISAVIEGTSTGTSIGVVNTGAHRVVETGTWEFVSPTSPSTPSFPGQRINQNLIATLGTLPVTLQPGESKTFVVEVNKNFAGVINGTLRVSASIVGPGNQPVACDVAAIPMTTQIAVPPPQEDPVAQTFFVDSIGGSSRGIFVSSVDIWFFEKDPVVPASVEIRPTVNGYPSSRDLIPFAFAVNSSDEIVTSTTFDATKYTRFTFQAPIYLPPGEYALVVRGNSTKYKIYTAVIGGTSLKTNNIVTGQPYVGSMFKSQNSSTWTAEQTEDITFRLNQCIFDTASAANLLLTAAVSGSNLEYDTVYPSGDIVKFNDSAINFYYKTTANTSLTLSSYAPAKLDTDLYQSERKILLGADGNSFPVKVEMQTFNNAVTPIFDLNRFQMIAITNIINNDATGEDDYFGGKAAARYITRKVTLNPGFEATDLKVYLNAYCPKNSSIRVYYKVNAPGTTDFERENKYVEFNSVTILGDQRAGYGEYTIGTALDKCLPDGSQFNTFTIKIVMLSDDPVYVPVVRDLRVIAVDD